MAEHFWGHFEKKIVQVSGILGLPTSPGVEIPPEQPSCLIFLVVIVKSEWKKRFLAPGSGCPVPETLQHAEPVAALPSQPLEAHFRALILGQLILLSLEVTAPSCHLDVHW